jgi:hypothetical protein
MGQDEEGRHRLVDSSPFCYTCGERGMATVSPPRQWENGMAVLHVDTATAKKLQREISGQMKGLPVEGLLALREFAAFLRQRAEQPTSSSAALLRHPTVEMSTDSLVGLMDLLPAIGGDALADTEALYDQV